MNDRIKAARDMTPAEYAVAKQRALADSRATTPAHPVDDVRTLSPADFKKAKAALSRPSYSLTTKK
jgi:hypothetical protein